MPPYGIAIIVILGILITLVVVPVNLLIKTRSAGVNVSLKTLISMRFLKIPTKRIISPLLKAKSAGVDIPADILINHFLTGGNIDNVVETLILMHQRAVPFNFMRAAAADLAGIDLIDFSQRLLSVDKEYSEEDVSHALNSYISEVGAENLDLARLSRR